MKINPRKRRHWGFTLLELLPPVGLVGMMGVGASMLLPALAKAKARANRIKCTSNISQVGRSFIAFADDNNDRFPWLLIGPDRARHGGGNANWVYETSTLFSVPAIKAELGSAKILVSPLDSDNQGVNDGIDLARVDIANPVPNGGHSYGVSVGSPTGRSADIHKPASILCVTRNISGPINDEDSLSDQKDNPPRFTAKTFAIWKGADKHPVDVRTMASLNAGAGQMGLSDGSARQTNDADLSAKVKAHHNNLGGMYKGSASGIIDTPND